MEDKLISRYDILVNRYKELVSEKLSRKDFIEYNEILFSAHSCAIEGNSFSVDETRTLKEKGLGMIPKGKTLLEAFEILDHFQAYEYLLKNLDRPLTEELLKETHRLLTEHTLSYKTQYDEIPSNPGEYTTVDMCAGDTIFGDHEQLIKQVPRLLQSTQQVLDSGKIHPIIIAAKFHGFYEYLHPFRDGNGRLGRLMSNFILLKKEQPLLIIPGSQREEYITALKYIKKERTDEFLIDFFFRTSIKRMEQEIEEKKNPNSTLQANFTAPKDYQYTIGVVNPPEDTSSALSISSSSNYDDIYEGYNNRTYKARYGETIELSIRYQSEKVDFAGWYENGTLLSTAEVYTFTPSDTPDRVRHITGKFVMKTTTEPSLTFNISAESPAGFISSGSIEVNIDGNKTILNTASGIRSFTITGRQKAVLTVKDLPDYINGEGRWLGWYVFYNGSEKQVSTSYTYEITTQGDATVYTARFQK